MAWLRCWICSPLPRRMSPHNITPKLAAYTRICGHSSRGRFMPKSHLQRTPQSSSCSLRMFFTSIHAGKYKAEGNTDAPLARSREPRQRHVDGYYRIFVESMARNRWATVERVESEFGRGRIIDVQDAVQRDMADRVGNVWNRSCWWSLERCPRETGWPCDGGEFRCCAGNDCRHQGRRLDCPCANS